MTTIWVKFLNLLMIFRAFLLYFLLGALLTACTNPESGDSINSALTSSWIRPDDPQEKIGAREHPSVLAKYGGVYNNPNTERMISVIVSKLVAVSQDPSRVYKITILNSPKVNAFALPGGFLYVTRGLLALANDSSEIAAVLSHEMAHVSANHALIRQERMSSAQLGEQVVMEVLDNNPAGKIALAANQIRLLRFSQDQELQADAIGIRMIGRAGYDPYAASRFLDTMSRYRDLANGNNSVGNEESFTSSHPSTPKRIELARRHARFFGAPGIGERDRERYLAGISGTLFGDTANEGFVRGNVFAHKGLKIRFEAPEGFRIENQAKAVLISGPEDIATRFDAVVLSSHTGLTKYLKSGWITGLIEETIREETINNLKTASAIARGEGWRFKIRVIRHNNQVYRFINAAPQTNTNLDAIARQITSSFKILSDSEAAELSPLKIKVITVQSGDTVQTISSRMEGSDQPEQLFRLLNGIGKAKQLEVGQKVKIVSSS